MIVIYFMRRRVEVTLQNIIVTSSVNFKINITKFAKLNNFTIDENYPSGVHCKGRDIIGMVTVFNSGKMISTGTKKLEQAKRNIAIVYGLIIKQRKQLEI